MAFTHIQGTAGHASAGSLTITTSPTVGNSLVVISFYVSNPGQVVSVTDNRSNVYAASLSEIILPNGAVANQYYGVQRNGGTTAITITLGSIQEVTAGLNEYTGGNITNATVFDTAASNSGTGTSSSVTLNSANSGELIEAGVIIFGNSVSPAAGANYTSGGFDQTLKTAFTEFRLSSTVSETAPASWTGLVPWAEIASAFIPTAPAAPVFNHIQGATNHATNVTQLDIILNNPTQQDSLVVVDFLVSASGQVNGIGDGANTYSSVISINNSNSSVTGLTFSGGEANQWFATQAFSGNTVISIFLSTPRDVIAVVNEYSGNNKYTYLVTDKIASATGTGTSASISLRPSAIGELIHSGLVATNSNINPVSGSDYVNGGFDQTAHTVYTQYRLSGTYAETAPVSWTGSSGWAEIATTFFAAIPPTLEAFANVQNNYDDTSLAPATSWTTTLAQATAQGNLVVINVQFDGSVSGITITDNTLPHNPYVLAVGPVQFATNPGQHYAYQYYGVQTTGGVTSLSISWIGSQVLWWAIDEYSGNLQSNATVLDTTASTTALTGSDSLGRYGTLSVNQLPKGTPATVNDPTLAPLLYPGSASNLVTGAFFTHLPIPSADTNYKGNNGYFTNLTSDNRISDTAQVVAIHRLTANAAEVPTLRWGSPRVNFAIIGASYKAQPVSGIQLVHKTQYAQSINNTDGGYRIYDAQTVPTSVFTSVIPATTQGNLLVINSWYANAAFVTSVTDNVGNTYVAAHAPVGGLSSGSGFLDKWYGVQVIGGATTITVTYSAVTNHDPPLNRYHMINEYTGTATSNATVLDVVSTKLVTNDPKIGATVSVEPFTTHSAGGLIEVSMANFVDTQISPGEDNYGYAHQAAGYHMINSAWLSDSTPASMYKISGAISETAPANGQYNPAGGSIIQWGAIAVAFKAGSPLITVSDAIHIAEFLDASGPYRSINQFELAGIGESSQMLLSFPYQSDQVMTSENTVVLIATGLILFVTVLDQIQTQEFTDLITSNIRVITISDAVATSEAVSHYSDNIRTSESTSVVISMPLTLINCSDGAASGEFIDTLRNGARDIYLTDNRLLDQNGNPLLDGFNHFILDQTPGGDLVSTSELLNFADKHLDLRVSNLVITKEQVRISTGRVSFIDTVYIPVVIP